MEPIMIPQFLIASPTVGAGKTAVTRMLMETLTRKGMKVQPYKCGPDYTELLLHERACGCPSVTLDLFFSSPEHVRKLYARHAEGADVCIVEGTGGLFDGRDRDQGSSAELAILLGLPVVLVVNAKLATYSLAAMIGGYIRFDKRVQIAGVIFNQVESEQQEKRLHEMCIEQKIEYLGCVAHDPKQKDKFFPRKESILWQRLLQATRQKVPACKKNKNEKLKLNTMLHIVVARNETSFTSLYAEHLEQLARIGSITFIDPESTKRLPPKVDLLYLPGGCPELHAVRLTSNKTLLSSINAYIEAGGRTLAEGGGLVYLSKGIYLPTRKTAPYWMVNAFPFSIGGKEEHLKRSQGYRRFELGGQTLRGYEWHHTQVMPGDTGIKSAAQVYDEKGYPTATLVYRYKNAIASYTHLYWGEIDVMKLFDSPFHTL